MAPTQDVPYHPQQPQLHHNDTLGFDPALGYMGIPFAMEQWICWISGAIKRVDLREESSSKASPPIRQNAVMELRR